MRLITHGQFFSGPELYSFVGDRVLRSGSRMLLCNSQLAVTLCYFKTLQKSLFNLSFHKQLVYRSDYNSVLLGKNSFSYYKEVAKFLKLYM